MNKFRNLRLPGIKLAGEVIDRHNKIIFEDKHTVIEILLGSYSHDGMNYIVAGHNCHVGEDHVAINPNPENGLYTSERNAIVYMLHYLYETYGQQWPSEVVKIIELAVWEYRQTSIFD